MIKLSKGPIPEILERKSGEWTQTILQKMEAGESLTKADRSHYNHPDIKNAVIAETHGKCVYCESKIKHISYGDIEHIIPKSIVPERWFDWKNLTLACTVCNVNKSNHHSDEGLFIDPYATDPREHLWFLGATIFPFPGSEVGAITERIVGLNRAALIEKRAERLRGLMKLLEVIHRTQDKNLRAILEGDFLEETKDDKEFAGLARAIVELAKSKNALGSELPATTTGCIEL